MRTYRSKNNTGLYFILAAICGILLTGFGIWAIVEFILYLVKDNPFNWWSLWLTIAAVIGELFFMVKMIFSD